MTDYFAAGGIAEALPGSVSIMAETCESEDSIDIRRAQEARTRANNRIAEGRKNRDVVRALNRLKVSSR